LGGQNERHQKIERGRSALALGGRRFKCLNKNQMGYGDDVKGCVGEETGLGQNVWGGWLPVIWGVREMGRPLALDGRRLIGGHNNQPKVDVNGEGGVREETRPGRNVWGALSYCLGRQMEASNKKDREMGWALATDGRRLKILHTITNQKQAAASEGTMKGRRNEREAWGKHDTIVFGWHYS
jgi:hypothetical protein